VNYQPANSKSLARGLLGEIGRHIESGPGTVVPPDATEGDSLFQAIKLTQIPLGRDPYESLALLVPPPESLPTKLLPVIRKVYWRKRGSQPRTWPDIRVDYYRVQRALFAQLEEAVVALDRSAEHIVFFNPGLNLAEIYDASPSEEAPPGKAAQPLEYYRGVVHTASPHFEIWFYGEQEAPKLNEAWLNLWEELVACCRDSERIHNCIERYGLSLTPEEYRDALAGR
jgi:hypothetical protein